MAEVLGCSVHGYGARRPGGHDQADGDEDDAQDHRSPGAARILPSGVNEVGEHGVGSGARSRSVGLRGQPPSTWMSMRVGGQSQPASRAMRMASMRLRPPTLLIALDR